MSLTAEKIKQIEGLRAHGATVSEAVSKALGSSLAAFAERTGVRKTEVYMCLNGYHHREYAKIRDAICAELEIPRAYLDRLIDEQKGAAA